MTLANATLLPGAMLPLYIFEPRYRQMLDDVLAGDRMFSVALQDPTTTAERPVKMAGLGLVRASMKNEDETSHLILQGIARIRFKGTVTCKPYRVEKIEIIPSDSPSSTEADTLAGKVRALLHQATHSSDSLGAGHEPADDDREQSQESRAAARDFVDQLREIEDPGTLADIVAGTCLRRPKQRQEILEALEPELRLRKLISFLTASAV